VPVIRTVHHLAATGGTLIAKCIAAVESVWLASEIDPFTEESIAFAPRQLLGGLDARYGILSETDLRDQFVWQLERALALAAREHKHLVIREYTNPAYYSPVLAARLVVLDLLRAEGYATRSVATVRHPLDSYLALLENVWLLKELRSLEVYSARYLRFLADVRAAELPVFRYEDFVADPDAQLHRIVDALELDFPDGFRERIGSITLTGDSGRSGAEIAPRPRRRPARPVLRQVRRELDAPSYLELCEQLGYRPGFDEDPRA
jgi:hypothetical protein